MNSMTGQGSHRGKAGGSHYKVEVRSVNHRFCDTKVRLPGRLALMEPEIAALIRRRFVRGKFDVFIKEEAADRSRVERDLARRCYRLLKQIQRDLGLQGDVGLSDLLTFRGFYAQNSSVVDNFSSTRRGLLRVVEGALTQLERMRAREGRHLNQWFRNRLVRLNKIMRLAERDANRGHRQRMLETRKMVPTDKAVEAALARGDVTEEVVRLKSHLKQFSKTFRASGAVGRRLDFLTQEMVREINTLGSKVQGVRAVHRVIDFKTELEKVREQIQNIE